MCCNQRGQRGRCCCNRGLGNLGLAHNAGCNTSSSGEALGTAQDGINFKADVASSYLVRKSARSCLHSKQGHISEFWVLATKHLSDRLCPEGPHCNILFVIGHEYPPALRVTDKLLTPVAEVEHTACMMTLLTIARFRPRLAKRALR